MVDCGICKRLTAQYKNADQVYRQAISEYSSLSESVSTDDYISLRRIADEARIDAEVARIELDQHKQVHSRNN